MLIDETEKALTEFLMLDWIDDEKVEENGAVGSW